MSDLSALWGEKGGVGGAGERERVYKPL